MTFLDPTTFQATAGHANALPGGDPATGQVGLAPLIDVGSWTTRPPPAASTVDACARARRRRWPRSRRRAVLPRTVLDGVTTGTAAYDRDVLGPVAPVVRFTFNDEAVKLAATSDYGLSPGILTCDMTRRPALAERMSTGTVHIRRSAWMSSQSSGGPRSAATLCLPRKASEQLRRHARTPAGRRRDGRVGGWQAWRDGPGP